MERHKDCLRFLNMHRELIVKMNNQASSDDNLFNSIYDLLCAGNDIDASISQSQFDKTNGFNPYKYFKEELNYDVVEQIKNNQKLREKVLMIDESNISRREVIDLFADMERSVFNLNNLILEKKRKYEIQKALSQKTIF